MVNLRDLFGALAVGFLFTSCGAASEMATRDGWRAQFINLGEYQIQFSVPDDQGLVSLAPPDYFDLDGAELARTDRLPPKVYMASWGFGRGSWKQPEGTLSIDVMPGSGPIDFDGDVREPDDLRRAIYSWDVAFYKNALNQKLTEPPKPFEVVGLNGSDWIIFQDNSDNTYMAVALDQTYYIYVVVDLNLDERSKYYETAKEIANQIVSSFIVLPLDSASEHSKEH